MKSSVEIELFAENFHEVKRMGIDVFELHSVCWKDRCSFSISCIFKAFSSYDSSPVHRTIHRVDHMFQDLFIGGCSWFNNRFVMGNRPISCYFVQ